MKKMEELQLKEEVKDQLIAIGDVHGLTKWRKVIEAQPDAQTYVFLGDYCDPYGLSVTDEKVLDNLIDILDFKKRYPDRVVLLLGNHDIHYLMPQTQKGSRYNEGLAMMLYDLFKGNESLFTCAYACHHLLFTHAGVLRSWFEDFGGDLNEPIADQLIERSDDLTLMQCSFLRGGEADFGGIYWADKAEFCEEELLPGYIQIVGHNRVPTIQVEGDSILSTGTAIFCDSLYRDYYLVVDHPEAEEPEFYEANLNEKA